MPVPIRGDTIMCRNGSRLPGAVARRLEAGQAARRRPRRDGVPALRLAGGHDGRALDLPLDAGRFVLNAQYLDGHGWLPPVYVSYEYSAPPLYRVRGRRARPLVRAVPSLPLEFPVESRHPADLVRPRPGVGARDPLGPPEVPPHRCRGGRARAALWALDEAISLGNTATGRPGSSLSLGAAPASSSSRP